MLLHAKTREQLDINIKDSVVIIDEAHNLLDTIASIHSAEITSEQLQSAHQQLSAYKTNYLDRFSTKNLLRLNQLISIAHRFNRLMIKPLTESSKSPKIDSQAEFTSKMVLTHDLLDEVNISYGNLFEIIQFCEETRLAQKISGFALRYANTEIILKPKIEEKKSNHLSYLQQLSKKLANKPSQELQKENNSTQTKSPIENTSRLGSAAVIRILLNFLETLLEKSSDGRILLSRHKTTQSKSFIKYLLLNANEPFARLMNDCRAVIVAGGTMQPTTEFKTQLFQNFKERIEEYFYGHVVAAEAILPMVVSKGPKNSSFLFNYVNRGNNEMVSNFVLKNVFLFFIYLAIDLQGNN